jgi:hypothetical protein
MSLGQNIFVEFFNVVLGTGKEILEQRRVERMTPEEQRAWRTKEIAEGHEKALKLAGKYSVRELRKLNIDCAQLVRKFEVVRRNDRGLRMSQNLLEGMDIRGLDLRKVPHLSQEHIDTAHSDGTTVLSDYLNTPPKWSLS